MDKNKGFKEIVLEAIETHHSLDHKLLLMEELRELFTKVERYEKALADIRNVSTLDEYEGANPKSLLKACYDIAREATS